MGSGIKYYSGKNNGKFFLFNIIYRDIKQTSSIDWSIFQNSNFVTFKLKAQYSIIFLFVVFTD